MTEIDERTLEENDLEFLRNIALSEGIQYFNARFSKGQSTTFSILNGITKSSKTGMGHGFSIQTFYQGGWGIAIGHDFNHDSILTTFHNSAKLAKWSSQYSKGPYTIDETTSGKQSYKVAQKISLNSIGPGLAALGMPPE